MTDLLPEVAREARVTPPCTASRHGGGERDWRRGCRCPGALAAHERRLAAQRPRNRRQPAQVDEQGNCIAADHGPSERAFRRGCRCEGTVEVHEEALKAQRRASYARRKPPRPWEFWRGPDMKVYRWNLFLLVHGFLADEPTRGERIAAVYLLTGSPNRYGTGINNRSDIAQIINWDPRKVAHIQCHIKRSREVRHKRRLADVKLRAYRRELAVERGRGHDRSGHPIHPWWLALAYDQMTRDDLTRTAFAPNPAGGAS